VPGWAPPVDLDRDGDDVGPPLVVVGFSTTFQNHGAALQRVVDALAELPVRAVVTLGHGLTEGEIASTENAQILAGASHDALMRRAALVVTHGGHGTVCRALVHRRPLLVMPHGRDQADNAVRVTARGTGLALPPSATVEEIRTTVARLLSEPAFAEAAARLGAAMAEDVAHSQVVELLEGFAGTSGATRQAALSPG
jgi:UDP:flavonoid glycosyltransferase YjiC (YdhE family)